MTKQQEKKSIITSSSIMFIAFIGYGLLYTQIIPYMESLGMDSSMRGIVLSASAILGIVIQLITGYLSDRYQMIKSMTIVAHLIFGILGLFGYSSWFKNEIVAYFVLILLAVAFFRIASNLLESWIYEIDEHTQKHFGIVRLFGSFGWALGSFVVSFLVINFGYQGIGITFGLLMIGDALLMMFLKAPKKVSASLSLNWLDVRKLFQNKQYILMIIIFFWLFMINNLNGLTVIDRLLELQATSQEISNYWTISSISELLLMAVGGYFIHRFGGKKILIFTSFLLVIRFVLYGLADSTHQIIIISLLQGIIFPFMLLSQKRMVTLLTPLELRSSGHMVMTAITSNIPIILTPILSGYLIQIFEINQILLVAGLSCVIPLVLSFFSKE